MHKNNILKKGLVWGIILLFFGLSVTSNISGNIEKSSNLSTEITPTSFPLDRGLMGYWKFDEGSGNIAYDSSGHGYDGTIYGATWTTGGLDFDGVDDYVEMDAYSEHLGYNKTDDVVISAWFKSTSTNAGTIYSMSHTIPSRVYCYLTLNSDGTVSFNHGDETCEHVVSSSGAYNDGDLHFVEVKYYGDPVDPTTELYIDDDFEDSVTKWLCPMLANDFKATKVGRRAAEEVNYFDGVIDDVKIYKYPAGESQPPYAPTITGDTEVGTGKSIDYYFTAIDPDGDDVKYHITWGDSDSETTGFNPSGATVTVPHTWDEQGTYTIKATAEDTGGLIGPEGTLAVKVPVNYNQQTTQQSTKLLFLQILERLLPRLC